MPIRRLALLAAACAVITAACTGPNPDSCIPKPSMCAAGTKCDMTTGECVAGDGGSSEAPTDTASDGADGPVGDGPADKAADSPADTARDAANGEECASNAGCASGHCADGVCCDTACTGSCLSCALPSSKGKCSAVKSADDADTCSLAMMETCDAKGACALRGGQKCAGAAECASGFCADGVCCDTACGGECLSCALAMTTGTCSPVKSADDADSCTPASSTCDAAGACKLKIASKCDGGSDCASGYCADGLCCNTGCTESCRSCSLSGKEGTCSAVAGAEDLDTCSGSYTCSAAAACRLKDGQACSSNETCASSICGVFFRDTDDDGYGDAKMSASFCSSPPTASPPWVVRGDDCCDKDPLVYPGQKDFQPSESTACGTSWDYDCNGSPDREYPSTVSCSMTDYMCDASAHDGWTGVIPTCGANGTLARCGNTLCGPISCCDVTSSTSGFKQKCK